MLKLLYAVATGIFGAIVLHIIIILALPHFTGKDAYTRVLAEGTAFEFHRLSNAPDTTGLLSRDPYMRVAVCHFDITSQPLRLVAVAGRTFWSVGIFDAASNEVFSMNDRTSVAGDLDVLLATPVQVAQLRRSPIAALTETIVVEHRGTRGYAVLRTMVPLPSFEPEAIQFLSAAECLPLPSSPG
ncbi:DUF1254 domain-containing protein [Peteryoungia desertarenae]|uniref:DUF1254 domain-containing protein n=1 Tax=Peteryoungia desertarenae TaxID=1813451 RepID=A0ABX6QNJ7_9HYPH|nr:DUF1254 domain-containing protein [Peteryoungia desertarenae]QLF69827.1 DUF1254 domain-containing protein [Peteryoungia desertarenae]